MTKTVLKLAGFGFLLGMVVGVLIAVLFGFTNGGPLLLPPVLLAATGSESGALLAHMLLSGLYGAIPWAGVAFYEIESWGLLKQAAVHYVTYTAAFMLIGTCAGWIEPTLSKMGLVAGIFLVCHAIIWLIMYAKYKAEADELSTLLQKTKQGA